MKNFNGKRPIYHLWDEPSFVMDTAYLPWMERLIYRALLQTAWYCSSRPDLPNDDIQLQRMLGIPESVWNEHKAGVRAMFQSDTVNDQPVLFQKRLRRDWATLEEIRRKKTDAAEVRWSKEKSGIVPLTPKSNIVVQASSDVKLIMTAVFKACGKTPIVADVERLLASHTAEVIVGAFDDYYSSLTENGDLENAGLVFFHRDDGAGGEIICNAWKRSQNAI